VAHLAAPIAITNVTIKQAKADRVDRDLERRSSSKNLPDPIGHFVSNLGTGESGRRAKNSFAMGMGKFRPLLGKIRN
jgi:hypothetical protein